MSRERARRRAERQAIADHERAVRARQVARRARWRSLRTSVTRPLTGLAALTGLTGRRRPDSALRRHRGRQNGALLAVLVSVNGVLWLLNPSWLLRGSVLALSVLAWPLLVVLVFDRRHSR